MALLDSLDDPDKQALLAAGLSMLAPKQQRTSLLGDIGSSGLLGLQTLLQGKQQERTNRASDLQQLTGLQSALYANEFPRMLQMGKDYTPGPDMQMVNSRINDLVAKMNLSGGRSGASVASPPMPPAPSAPPAVPGVAAPSTSPMADPNYQPVSGMVRPDSATPAPAAGPSPQAAGGMPSSVYGIPAPLFLAAGRAGPGALALLQEMAKSRAPVNMRAGSTAAQWDEATQSVKPGFYAPKFAEGIQPSYGPNGQVTASPVPGYTAAQSGLSEATARGTAAGQFPGRVEMVKMADGRMVPKLLADLVGNPYGGAQASASGLPFVTPSTVPPSQVARVTVTQPSQQAQAVPGGVGQSTTAESEQRGMGENYAKAYSELRENAASAPQNKATLQELQGLANGALNGQTGASAAFKQKLGEWMIAGGVKPEDVNKSLNIDVPSAQEFVKLALQRAMQQTRTMGAREAASVFQSVASANPNLGLTTQGVNKILAPLIAEQDWNNQKFLAADDWYARNKSLAGFESNWNKNQSFSKYWQDAQKIPAQSPNAAPSQNMTPAQLVEMYRTKR